MNFVEWMRQHNDGIECDARQKGSQFAHHDKVGSWHRFCWNVRGSVFAIRSMNAVIDAITLTVLHIYNDHNINSNLPSFRYACFDHCDKDAQTYAFSTRFFLASSCEKQALSVLARLVQGGPNEVVAAEMNAMVVRDAEKYYRTMIGGGAQSWNQRDTHMLKMLEKIVKYEEKATGKEARAVVWPHNSHVGDARATDQGTDRHEVTIGQLAREKWWRAGVQHWIHHSYRDCFGEEAIDCLLLVILDTVTASSDWDAPMEKIQGVENNGCKHIVDPDLTRELGKVQLERAIGVIYRPETELMSHYFEARMEGQFDAVVHVDKSNALRSLNDEAGTAEKESPETYPFE
ncbi:hypothetical protein BC938DRAFT_474815 [Jimgerdemannia flammicorona]|uniref:Uncharacterized protein n=1 Tax=Jimgerdemannia flammicorona TaxID=994334 RepID=A0A433QZG9_9FUNG|nr:hypothetical protein BC938DRAFT_474815 [Jimgerdemannia flammicorona]